MPPLIPEPFPVAFLISSLPSKQFPVPFSFYGVCILLPGSVALGNSKQTDKGQPLGTVSEAPPGPRARYGPVRPRGAARATANVTELTVQWLRTRQEQTGKASVAPHPTTARLLTRSNSNTGTP